MNEIIWPRPETYENWKDFAAALVAALDQQQQLLAAMLEYTVRTDQVQSFTTVQKTQGRANIGAAAAP